MIQEGVLVLPEEVGQQPAGSTVTGDVPLQSIPSMASAAVQINPFEPLLFKPHPQKSYWYFLLHPKQLFGSRPLDAAEVEHMRITTSPSTEN